MVHNRKATPSGGDPCEEIAGVAEHLKLTSLTLEAVRTLIDRAEEDHQSFSAFALRMLQTEERTRREKRLNRNLKRSKLGSVADNLDGFDFSLRPKLQERVVRELLHCRWAEEHRNVICVGRPGLGKTRIIKALGHAACEHGYSATYAITAQVLDDLQASLADGSFKRTLSRYQKVDVLLLDEFGYEPFEKKATQHLFRLVSARHGKAATLLAANTGFRKWKNIFPSEAQAVATVDRLIDNATILSFTGKSFRKPQDGSLDDSED